VINCSAKEIKKKMNFNVPQFIDVEDKIAFQLTAKQLGWFALGGVILFFIWKFFTSGVFFLFLILIPLICSAFAFYRPQGLPLSIFIFNGIKFLIFPKRMVWKKASRELPKKKEPVTKQETPKKIKRKDISQVKELANILDNSFKIN